MHSGEHQPPKRCPNSNHLPCQVDGRTLRISATSPRPYTSLVSPHKTKSLHRLPNLKRSSSEVRTNSHLCKKGTTSSTTEKYSTTVEPWDGTVGKQRSNNKSIVIRRIAPNHSILSSSHHQKSRHRVAQPSTDNFAHIKTTSSLQSKNANSKSHTSSSYFLTPSSSHQALVPQRPPTATLNRLQDSKSIGHSRATTPVLKSQPEQKLFKYPKFRKPLKEKYKPSKSDFTNKSETNKTNKSETNKTNKSETNKTNKSETNNSQRKKKVKKFQSIEPRIYDHSIKDAFGYLSSKDVATELRRVVRTTQSKLINDKTSISRQSPLLDSFNVVDQITKKNIKHLAGPSYLISEDRHPSVVQKYDQVENRRTDQLSPRTFSSTQFVGRSHQPKNVLDFFSPMPINNRKKRIRLPKLISVEAIHNSFSNGSSGSAVNYSIPPSIKSRNVSGHTIFTQSPTLPTKVLQSNEERPWYKHRAGPSRESLLARISSPTASTVPLRSSTILLNPVDKIETKPQRVKVLHLLPKLVQRREIPIQSKKVSREIWTKRNEVKTVDMATIHCDSHSPLVDASLHTSKGPISCNSRTERSINHTTSIHTKTLNESEGKSGKMEFCQHLLTGEGFEEVNGGIGVRHNQDNGCHPCKGTSDNVNILAQLNSVDVETSTGATTKESSETLEVFGFRYNDDSPEIEKGMTRDGDQIKQIDDEHTTEYVETFDEKTTINRELYVKNVTMQPILQNTGNSERVEKTERYGTDLSTTTSHTMSHCNDIIIGKLPEALPLNDRRGIHSHLDPRDIVDTLVTFLTTKRVYKTLEDHGCLGNLKDRSQSMADELLTSKTVFQEEGPVAEQSRNSLSENSNRFFSVLKMIWGGTRQSDKYEDEILINEIGSHKEDTESVSDESINNGVTISSITAMNTGTVSPNVSITASSSPCETQLPNPSSSLSSTRIISSTPDLTSSLLDPQYWQLRDQHPDVKNNCNHFTSSQFRSNFMVLQQQINPFFQRSEPPHPSQFRDFTKVLPLDSMIQDLENASSPDNTLIIWDWDDTILPTFHLAVEHRLNITDSYVPEALKGPLAELESRVLQSLELSMKNGCTILITNASFRWLTDSAEKYFPKLWEFIKEHKVMILSARDVCQPLGFPQPDWKKLLIRDQVERFFAHLGVSVQVVADAVTVVKSIIVDHDFLRRFMEGKMFSSESRTDQQDENNGNMNDIDESARFYIDGSISEDRRLDRFARQISKMYGIHPRVFAMAGLLLSAGSDSVHPNDDLSDASWPGDFNIEKTDERSNKAVCHDKRDASCPRCQALDRSTEEEAALTDRVRVRYLTEGIQDHSTKFNCKLIDRLSLHNYLISNCRGDGTLTPQHDSITFRLKDFNDGTDENSNESITVCPYHEQLDSELANIFGSAPPGTRASSFVRLTSGRIISMKELFPTPSNEFGLAPIPCSVISIGDGLGEREAVLSVMTQWDLHHRMVLQHLRDLRDHLHLTVFKCFIDFIMRQYANTVHHPINNSLIADGARMEPTFISSPSIGTFHCKLKAPSAAWSFKSLKLAPHPDILQLSQTHHKVQGVLKLILQVKHSIDAIVEESQQHPIESTRQQTSMPHLGDRIPPQLSSNHPLIVRSGKQYPYLPSTITHPSSSQFPFSKPFYTTLQFNHSSSIIPKIVSQPQISQQHRNRSVFLSNQSSHHNQHYNPTIIPTAIHN